MRSRPDKLPPSTPASPQFGRVNFTRRQFIGANIGLALATSANAYGAVVDSPVALQEIPIRLPKLPREFDGYRIGFLTDPHVGIFVSPDSVAESLSQLQSAGIDLLLLGGDYFSYEDSARKRGIGLTRNEQAERYPVPELPVRLLTDFCAVLKGIAPRDGIYGVLGNHDRFINPQFAAAEFARSGAKLLLNSSAAINRGSARLHIDGVEDLWYGAPRLPAAAPQSASEFRVLLTHNPDYFSVALAQLNYEFSLGIAGHTHGGQIRLPLVPPMKRNCYDWRFFEGKTEVRGTHFYTSRGLGVTALPWRVNCAPEVTVFTLTLG